MEFKLQFNIPACEHKISYTDKFVLSGSCFAENISEKLRSHKFNSTVNSHGIAFNPESICKALHDVIKHKIYDAKDLFYFNDCWHSWEHHSVFSDPNQDNCLNRINIE